MSTITVDESRNAKADIKSMGQFTQVAAPIHPPVMIVQPHGGALLPPVGHPDRPAAYPGFTAGHAANPAGRPKAGAVIEEWLNELGSDKELSIQELERIAKSDKRPARRAAATQVLLSSHAGDLADYEPWLAGEASIGELKASGIGTYGVKTAKVRRSRRVGADGEAWDVEHREIELYDRAGGAWDRILARTPVPQRIEVVDVSRSPSDVLADIQAELARFSGRELVEVAPLASASDAALLAEVERRGLRDATSMVSLHHAQPTTPDDASRSGGPDRQSDPCQDASTRDRVAGQADAGEDARTDRQADAPADAGNHQAGEMETTQRGQVQGMASRLHAAIPGRDDGETVKEQDSASGSGVLNFSTSGQKNRVLDSASAVSHVEHVAQGSPKPVSPSRRAAAAAMLDDEELIVVAEE